MAFSYRTLPAVAATLTLTLIAGCASQIAANLAAISAGLPVITQCALARTWSSFGFPLTGGSLIQDASEEMHLVLLPAANAINASESENAALTSASAQAAGSAWGLSRRLAEYR